MKLACEWQESCIARVTRTGCTPAALHSPSPTIDSVHGGRAPKHGRAVTVAARWSAYDYDGRFIGFGRAKEKRWLGFYSGAFL